jgi:hypothetical protein
VSGMVQEEAEGFSPGVSTGTCHCDRDHWTSMPCPTALRKLCMKVVFMQCC